MITARDIDKVLSLLRRVYGSIVIDMSSVLNDINLAFLDLSDTILEIVTYDSTTIHNTVAVADAFRMIGYPPSKVRYLVNRADSAGGIDPGDLERAIGRVPEHRVVSDGMLVVQSEQRGRPVRAGEPRGADQPGRGADRRGDPRGPRHRRHRSRAGASRRPGVGPSPDRRLRLRGGRAHRPPRDPPPVAGRIDDLPRRQRAGAVRRRAPTRRCWPSRPRRSTRSSIATSRRSSSPATPRRPSPWPTSADATTCRSWASSGPER